MYFPKTKIIPDQYTNGNELVYKDTNQFYQGYYHILANGTVFSGKNTTDGIPRELVFIQNIQEPGDEETQNYAPSPTSVFRLYDFETSKLFYDNIRLKQGIEYPLTTLIEPEYALPTPSYPSFIRYFVKRVNSNTYLEVSKETYSNLESKNNAYNWPAYITFTLPWTTGGASRQEIEKINRNIVLLTEQRLKLYGFSQYITDYTEFA